MIIWAGAVRPKTKKTKQNRKSVTDGPVERATCRPTDRRTDGLTRNADHTTLLFKISFDFFTRWFSKQKYIKMLIHAG